MERLVAGDRLEVNARALSDRFASAMDRVSQLIQLALPNLVDVLFPEDADALTELRTITLDALPVAESAADLLRAVVEAVTQDDVPQSPDFVRIMSLHKSKGLTADLVVLAGLVEGLVPRINRKLSALEQAALLEEQRRLCFVGMTRTTNILVLSSYSQLPDSLAYNLQVRLGSRIGSNFVTFASSFLSEMGPHLPTAVTGDQWLRPCDIIKRKQRTYNASTDTPNS